MRCARPVQGPRGALATALMRDAYRIASTGLTRYARYGALITLSSALCYPRSSCSRSLLTGGIR